MAQTSFVVDAATAKTIEELKEPFGVKTNAAVIRKALALARIAANKSGPDRTITIVDADEERHKIMLAG